MIKINQILLLVIITTLLVSCESVKVMSEYDKKQDFKQYKSIKFYGWSENSGQVLNTYDKERLENAISLEFRKRGHKFVKENNDLIVSLYIITERSIQEAKNTNMYVSASVGPAYGYGGYGMGGYYGYGPGWGWGTGYTTQIKTEKKDITYGTLVISVYDASKEELIWEGIGIGSIGENPRNREANLNKAITRIMDRYPVRKISK